MFACIQREQEIADSDAQADQVFGVSPSGLVTERPVSPSGGAEADMHPPLRRDTQPVDKTHIVAGVRDLDGSERQRPNSRLLEGGGRPVREVHGKVVAQVLQCNCSHNDPLP
jgi:hypothetical protein